MGMSRGRAPGRRHPQVIELHLMSPQEMFEMPQTDLFSEYRNFRTGIDFCVSELRGRRSRRPVQLRIWLPPATIDAAVPGLLSRTLSRYCGHRLRYNQLEARAQRVDAVSALRIGVPVSAAGLIVTAAAARLHPASGAASVVTDHLGWVLAWIGLWYPLDQVFFYPLQYGREARTLRLLAQAQIDVRPWPARQPVLAGAGR